MQLQGREPARREARRRAGAQGDVRERQHGGRELHKAKCREALFFEALAQRVDFSGADLSMCVFLRAKCEGARFDNADLTYAELSHADVSRADFSGATLQRARMHRTKEDGAKYGANRSAAINTDEDIAQAEDWRAAS